jgi:hypothetical protein
MNIEFETTIEIQGRELHVMVQADGHVYTHNYGEDADGNRGELRTEVDDFEMTVLDGHGKDISVKLRAEYPNEWQRLDEMAADKLIDAYNEGPEYERED